MGELRVLTSFGAEELADVPESMRNGGDTRITWNKDDDEEVKVASGVFKKLVKKGFKAFKVKSKKGEKGERLNEFNANEEMMILVPALAGG
jgi:hypothetical protein